MAEANPIVIDADDSGPACGRKSRLDVLAEGALEQGHARLGEQRSEVEHPTRVGGERGKPLVHQFVEPPRHRQLAGAIEIAVLSRKCAAELEREEGVAAGRLEQALQRSPRIGGAERLAQEALQRTQAERTKPKTCEQRAYVRMLQPQRRLDLFAAPKG